MRRICIAPIVEGHGEVEAVRLLLERIWFELLGGEYIEVLHPIRRKRHLIVRKDELLRAVRLAGSKLREIRTADTRKLVLILIDADEDLPCILAPQLQDHLREYAAIADTACVLANVEYETWFVAAAESLGEFLEFSKGDRLPDAPEAMRCGKGWIQRHFKEPRYSETRHQPRMTARMDMSMARTRSPSFDKLCRELASRVVD